MPRKLTAAFAVAALGLTFGAAATPVAPARQEATPTFGFASQLWAGQQTHEVVLKVFPTGTNVHALTFTYQGVVVTTSLSSHVQGTPTSFVKLVVAHSSKPKAGPHGTYSWTRFNPSNSFSTAKVVKIAFKVDPNIPKKKWVCVKIKAVGTSPGWKKSMPAGSGQCLKGINWLQPLGST